MVGIQMKRACGAREAYDYGNVVATGKLILSSDLALPKLAFKMRSIVDLRDRFFETVALHSGREWPGTIRWPMSTDKACPRPQWSPTPIDSLNR